MDVKTRTASIKPISAKVIPSVAVSTESVSLSPLMSNARPRVIKSGIQQTSDSQASHSSRNAHKTRFVRVLNDGCNRIFTALAKVLSTTVLIVLATLVLAVLCLAGWLYGVWQNRRLSGMPGPVDSGFKPEASTLQKLRQ